MTKKTKRPAAKVTAVHPAGGDHAVLTVVTPAAGDAGHCRVPCAECPWRKDRPRGVFPPEAFRHSARTCEDGSLTTFACHMTGREHPKTCAGFILSDDAVHNLALRIRAAQGGFDFDDVKPLPGVETFRNYSDMATANGVDLNDLSLTRTRSRTEARFRK